MKIIEILRWPQNAKNRRLPWFTTAWRSFWYLPLILALWVAFLSILIAYGYNEARRFWYNAT